jgi:AcrR family transcriptional regulator
MATPMPAPTPPDGPPPGLRERKKQATRAALRAAALRLAVEHGVGNVTIEQIAAAVGISDRTFFNYFPTKEDVLVATTAASAEAIVTAFRARPRTESVLESIRAAVLTVTSRNILASPDQIDALRLVLGAPSLLAPQLAIMAGQEKALATAIAERVDPDGTAEDVLYPRLCAAAAVAALRIVLERWLTPHTDELPDIDQFSAEFDRALHTLAAGLDRP